MEKEKDDVTNADQANSSAAAATVTDSQNVAAMEAMLKAPPTMAPPTLAPEEEALARELTDAINELVSETIKIVIMMDENECSRTSKYNRPCETCVRISSLRQAVRKILRLTEKVSKR